jgi:DNA excision repair protein ERCC-2
VALQEVKVSVQGLLSSAFHPRDLAGGAESAGRLLEGTQGHQLVRSRRGSDYQTEVAVKYSYEWEDYRLVVSGRVDGLIKTATEIMVEEIKTTYLPLAAVELALGQMHETQLKLYLYFMMADHPHHQVSGRLTYLNLDDLAEKSFSVVITSAEGRALFEQLARPYLAARREQDQWLRTRDASLNQWEFPFPERRVGQDELMETVNQALTAERDLLVEAATGIGKTVAILYPALKRLASGRQFTRIFFLTAKTVGKEILKKTLSQAAAQGIRLRTVFIESRERVCPFGKPRCEPTNCPYGVDYYAKAKLVIPELLRQELLTSENVADYAHTYQACPFELSLDLALQADLIVADYNYLFDPGVYLRRFFSEGSRDYLFLIDEAHNLVTRGREMYSAELTESDLTRLKSLIPTDRRPLRNAIRALEAYFEMWRAELEDEQSRSLRIHQLPDLLPSELQRLVALVGEFLSDNPNFSKRDQLQPLFFKLLGGARIAAALSRDYTIFVTGDEAGRLKLRLYCINPGPLLRQRLAGGRLAIFFSATLSPRQYFQELLGCRPDVLYLRLGSPFPQENRLYLHIPEIDTRYRARSQTALKLARCIADFVMAHTGNYLVFFPSYQYLQTVQPWIKQLTGAGVTVYSQTSGMSDPAKQLFLNSLVRVDTGRSQLGLAVLGGMFGEGVDFPGEALIGVLIVGPGLPMVNEEQELIREYFEERNDAGFFYAYLVPGLIRVIQAAGRVFRRSEDKGVVILVDDRFNDERYQELLPPDWFLPGRAFSNPDYREALAAFWEEQTIGC